MTAGPAHRASALRAVVPRAVAVWLLLMLIETAHGTLRTLALTPYLGDLYARQVSVLSGSLLILLTAYLTSHWLRAETPRAQLLVGGLWLALTLLFELGLGHYGLGYSWERLAEDYDLVQGRLLPFGMVVLTLAPWVAARLHAHLDPPDAGAPAPR